MKRVITGKPKQRHWKGSTFRREMKSKLELGQVPWFMKPTRSKKSRKTGSHSKFSKPLPPSKTVDWGQLEIAPNGLSLERIEKEDTIEDQEK